MDAEQPASVTKTKKRANVRRAYELGRFYRAATLTAFVVAAVAAIAAATLGVRSLVWLSLTIAVWLVAFWRGGELERGAKYGLAAGIASLLLPLSLLLSCVADCARLGCCVISGIAITAVVAVVAGVAPLARSSWWSSWKTTVGVTLGASSVAAIRCAALDPGEATAFALGVLIGPCAASVARGVHSSWFRDAR